MTDREELFNGICLLVPDEDTRNRLYIMLDKYEITARSTEIAVMQEDRNEYLVRAFITAKIVKGCTERTLGFYGTEVRRSLAYIGKTVDDITTDDIRLYIAQRVHRDKISKITVGNEIRVLRSFFNYIFSEELILKNPMLRIEAIKKEKVKKEAFTELEIEKMRAALRTNRERAIFEILLSTGCRVSELVNVKLKEITGNEVLVHGKGQKDRTVYLNAKALYALERYLKERKDTNPYLFASGFFGMHQKNKETWYTRKSEVSEDKPISASSIESRISNLGRRVGVKAYPHKFRRTCATFALRRGMSIEQVSQMLGHESIETTQIYLDISEQDLKEAHRKFVM
nr:MAG TPA: SITE SPECIFIC RECOMBINASE XERD [Caudoviricetes sp.]